MSKVLFAGLLAGALTVPQACLSAETPNGFRLPPIPYAETIPWLAGSAPKSPSHLGLLLSPRPLAMSVATFAAPPLPNRDLLSSRILSDAIVSTE